VINLTQQLSDTDALNLNNNNINPVRQFAGLGTYLMGNKTFKNDTTSPLNSLSVTLTINYIKRNLRTILSEYLFAPNNATTRNAVSSRVNSFLNNLYIFSPAGGSSYNVICDSTNNTTASTNLVVDVQLTLATAVTTITLNIVNSEDLTTITSYTVR
jgi:phage tail sheath protein FI